MADILADLNRSQRSCRVRQQVDFGSANAPKSLRLPRRRKPRESLHLRQIKTLKPTFWWVFGFNGRDEGMGQSNKVAHDQSADEQLEKS